MYVAEARNYLYLLKNLGAMLLTFGVTLFFVKLIQCAINSIQKVSRMSYLTRNIPGPPATPIFGNSLTFVKRPNQLANIFKEWYASYGGVFKIWLGTRLYIVLASQKPVDKILSSNEFIDKNSDYEMLHEWLGTGVATVNGEKWFKRRKLLNKAFYFNRLSYFCNVVNEQSNVFLEMLEKNDFSKQHIDVSPFVSRCILDILVETGMNTKLETQKTKTSKYFDASIRLEEILYQKMLRPWLCIPMLWRFHPICREEQRCYKVIHSFTDKIIVERKQERRNVPSKNSETNKNLGFLDLLLDAQENDPSISDVEIRNEINTFMFGGQDTVSTNLTWVLRMISIHQDAQRKIQAELSNIFNNSLPEEISLKDIADMKFMECVIKETLRLYPSGPIFNRILKRDVQLENGFLLPKGASAQIHAFLLHRNPTTFPNPEKFDPDRFLLENSTDRQLYDYVPFSGGPRNCIGQKFAMVQEKIILAHLLSRYNIEAANGMENVEYQWDLVLRPKSGARIKLVKRVYSVYTEK